MTEIKKIKERQREVFLKGYYRSYFDKYSDILNEEEMLAQIDNSDLYFYRDIDYSDEDRSIWKTSFHLIRIELQILKNGKERLEKDLDFRNSLLGALRFWIRNDYKNSNWWQNQIGVPRVLTNIALALEDYLDEELISGLKRLISRGTFHAHEGIYEIADLDGTGKCKTADAWTGANLVWGAATTIRYAIWLEDEELLRIALNRLSDEIKVSAEGIQADGAFCQHGARWYSGGYGRSFVYEIAPIINIIRGTKFALPKEKTDLILMHILDGQRMMMNKGVFDFGAVGREYARPEALDAGMLRKAFPLIAEDEALERHGELTEFCDDLILGRDSFENTKYYDSIAQLCHKKNGIYIGIRGRKQGIYGAEICNSEGTLSYNMSYGTVSCIMESGGEYFNIAPVWDYSRIPGTTARRESDDELLGYRGWENRLETPCRSFGRADGECGAMTQFTAHDGISLTASYFVFDGALVSLGTDIKDDNPEKGELFTNVEQCISDFSEHGENMAKNGRIIYRNLDENTVFMSNTASQSGSWRRNHASQPDDIISKEIFSVSIPVTSHGKYAYMVSGVNEPEVIVVQNDSNCQAILVGGKKLMAVFHDDCVIACGDRVINGKKGEIILD